MRGTFGGENFGEGDFVNTATTRELSSFAWEAYLVLEGLTPCHNGGACRGADRLRVGSCETETRICEAREVRHVGQLGAGLAIVEGAAVGAPVVDDHE